MSKPKHTPGPWIVNLPLEGSSDVSVYAEIGPHKNKLFLARVYGEGTIVRRFPEREANARLIAAAPEMLKGLKDLLEVAQITGTITSKRSDTIQCAVDKVVAIIAKAEGRDK